MEEQHIIKYGKKEINISKHTIGIWKKLISIKDILEEDTFGIKLLHAVTDIPEEELKEQEWYSIYSVVENLSKYYLELDTKFYDEFIHDEVTYKFTNMPSMSFGQYIDIQTYYSQSDKYRTDNINRLMAMLYLPKGEDYDVSTLSERAEVFNNVDVKYLMGASFFFQLLTTSLKETTKVSSALKMTRLKILVVVYQKFTGGIYRLVSSLITTLQRWTTYRNNL